MAVAISSLAGLPPNHVSKIDMKMKIITIIFFFKSKRAERGVFFSTKIEIINTDTIIKTTPPNLEGVLRKIA